VFLVARYTSAFLGTLAVLLTYLTARRLFGPQHGLFAAALLAVAFLPVFFSHQAVNDGPQLAPIALSPFGSAGILTRGTRLDYVVAGIGLGFACGTKYPAGIVILPLVAAALSHLGAPGARGRVVTGLMLSGVAAAVAFVIAVPGIVFDTAGVLEDLRNLSVTPEGERKLGQAEQSGIRYYLWTLTWGLGWIPSVAALVGAVELARRYRTLALVLVPAPIVFILFMGIQERYFGRYLLPIFPLVCILASYGILRLPRAGRVSGSHRAGPRHAEGMDGRPSSEPRTPSSSPHSPASPMGPGESAWHSSTSRSNGISPRGQASGWQNPPSNHPAGLRPVSSARAHR
jgi:4-amino-4-deoxy-L-arabinose transferase-like glycosyltransferase